MKKFIPYLLLVIALGAALGYFLYKNAPSTLEQNESDFAIKNVDAITKINLSDEKGKQLVLTKNAQGKWLANGEYEVSDAAFSLLFTAIQKVNTLGPVPLNGIENVLRDLLKKHSKIEIYTDDKSPAKVYYVGGPTLDNKGTYMLMEIDGKTASKPYITYIPGLEAYLTSRYTNNLIHWRSRWVFQEKLHNIKRVQVSYTEDPSISFEINRVNKDSFEIENGKHEKENQPKQRFIQQYLSFYERISVEALQNEYAGKDSILQTAPFCIVAVTDMSGKEKKAVLYHAPITDASSAVADEHGRPLKYDLEHFYASLNDGKDFAIVQYYVWNKALRTYSEFFQKPQKSRPVLSK